MQTIDTANETTYLKNQWRMAIKAEREGNLDSALRHYYKARAEALWLLDYQIARGDQSGSMAIYTTLDTLRHKVDNIEQRPPISLRAEVMKLFSSLPGLLIQPFADKSTFVSGTNRKRRLAKLRAY